GQADGRAAAHDLVDGHPGEPRVGGDVEVKDIEADVAGETLETLHLPADVRILSTQRRAEQQRHSHAHAGITPGQEHGVLGPAAGDDPDVEACLLADELGHAVGDGVPDCAWHDA